MRPPQNRVYASLKRSRMHDDRSNEADDGAADAKSLSGGVGRVLIQRLASRNTSRTVPKDAAVQQAERQQCHEPPASHRRMLYRETRSANQAPHPKEASAPGNIEA